MELSSFNKESPEVFSEKLIDILNNGALSLIISIGHRTGLFDTMNKLPSSTSIQIADSAGLDERYIREWLGAMVVGRIIDYDPKQGTYSLPVEHAVWLTRQAQPDNISVFAQYIAVLGSVEDEIVECFKKGGGVPYSEFKRFHQVMAEDSGQTVVAALIDSILPLVPSLKRGLKRGIEVLDVGCGSGLALNLLAKTFPNSRFSGFDISDEAIERAEKETKKNNLTNLYFGVKNVSDWEENEKYDLITTFDAVHDQAETKQSCKREA